MGNTDLMIPQDTSGNLRLKGQKERSRTRLTRQVGVPEITGVLGESCESGGGGGCRAPFWEAVGGVAPVGGARGRWVLTSGRGDATPV